MIKKTTYITKASGQKERFSLKKLGASLKKAGAGESVVESILESINNEMHEGMTSREIYNRAFYLLKKKSTFTASKYKLKRAIYELGPTGFPFERFVGAIFKYSGYEVKIGKTLQGKCISHEVDIVASHKGKNIIMECKFHSTQGRFCDVKIPLYINSRYTDIREHQIKNTGHPHFSEGWVVTNTRFSKDATIYSECAGLKLLSWDKPYGKSLKDLIDITGLYPVTVSTLLTQREKQFLLSRDVVLCKELINDKLYLDQLEVSEERKHKILKEMEALCNVKSKDHGKHYKN